MIRAISNVFLTSILILGGTVTPASKANQTEDPAPENPRIIVQENLQELPDVNVTTKEAGADPKAVGKDARPVSPNTKSSEPREPAEKSIQKGILTEPWMAGDPVLATARLPLTYVQENVPYFTKRNIIFFGRLELDGTNYSGGVLEKDSGFDIRRFRLGIAGRFRFLPKWNYKLEVDLTDGENNLADFYVSRRSKRWGTLRIGNQKVAQTLSGQTSSLSNTFMERPLPVLAFTLNRRLGVGWDMHLKNLGANVTIFSRDPNKNEGSKGWATRAYFNPTRDQFQVVHIGASVMQLDSNGDARTRARPESFITNTRLVDTGTRSAIDSLSVLGLELAGSRGSMTVKSEFYTTQWSRPDTSKDPRYTGWYTQVSWFLTGEVAQYRDGKFIRPDIRGVNGAYQIAFRASSIDLNDRDVRGGREANLALGVNWYSQTHWRFMGNLIKVKAEDGPEGKQDPWIAQFRVQYYF